MMRTSSTAMVCLGCLSACSLSVEDQSQSSAPLLVEDDQWNVVVDGNGGVDVAAASAMDSGGNLYVVGHGTNLAQATSGKDWWIKKYDRDGFEITAGWDKRIDSGHGDDEALALAVDRSGDHIYVVGYGNDLINADTGEDWWVAKYTRDGDPVWKRYFASGPAGGAPFADRATGVAYDEVTGDIVIVGSWDKLVATDTATDVMLVRLDPDGNDVWQSGWSSPDADVSDLPHGVALDAKRGRVYVAGEGRNPDSRTGDADGVVLGFDLEDGALLWERFAGGSLHDAATALSVDGGGTLFVAGFGHDLVALGRSTGRDAWIERYHADGREVEKGLDLVLDDGGDEDFAGLAASPHGDGAVAAGGDNGDLWVVDLDERLEVTDEHLFDLGGTNLDRATHVMMTSWNVVHVVGTGRSDWWIKKFVR